jgi:hypothetical protein
MNPSIITDLVKEIDDKVGYSFPVYLPDDLEWENAFAEAIVNKCAAIACQHCQWHGHTAAKAMKEHFGMEEEK